MKLSTLCYIIKDDQVLMIHRTKKKNDFHEGKWNGLGGKFEPGESPEQCVIREVYEESGLKISKPKMRSFLSFPRFMNDEDWYVFLFVADEFTGELNSSSEGELKWIHRDKILDLNLWEGDRVFLQQLSQEGFCSGSFYYENGQLIDSHLIAHTQESTPLIMDSTLPPI